MISINNHQIELNNQLISRTLEYDGNGVSTVSCINLLTGNEYVKKRCREFAFDVNGTHIDSYGKAFISDVDGNLTHVGTIPQFMNAEIWTPQCGCEQLKMRFALPSLSLEITLNYLIYEGIPGLRKYLEFHSFADNLLIEKVLFDDTCLAPGEFADCDFYHGPANIPEPINFMHDGTEDIIRCHNPSMNEGYFMGNTAPGPLRYFMVYPHWHNIWNGYSFAAAQFAKYLNQGETFATDASLLAVYKGSYEVSRFRELIRRGLPEMPFPEGVMYCSWIPFLKNINEPLINELMERAAELGFRYFVLDDGWFTDNDWEVDAAKFPNGLEAVRKTAARLGLKFGLWFNIGSDYGLKDPDDEFAGRLEDGRPKKVGGGSRLCFASAHRERCIAKLLALAERYQLDYYKLDFSSQLSPYGIMPYGCFARDHAHHRGYRDSFIETYRSMKLLRDKLKQRFPQLIVDFSFEVFGTDKPNIAALEFSELSHVSNLNANNPAFQSIERVRKSFYTWCGILPPERLLHGLLAVHGDHGDEYFLTSLLGAPLVAGDLRTLTPEQHHKIKDYADLFHELTSDGALTELEVIANEEDFDAFRRFDKSGKGFICLFNHSVAPRTIDGKYTVQPNSCVMYKL